MKSERKMDCGCRIIGEKFFEIDYCAIHAAPAMTEKLECGCRVAKIVNLDNGETTYEIEATDCQYAAALVELETITRSELRWRSKARKIIWDALDIETNEQAQALAQTGEPAEGGRDE